MQTEHIKTVLKIAETGQFLTAARQLNIALRTSYARVAAVERELGFTIFDRVFGIRGEFVLTNKGARWLSFARKAIFLLEQGKGAVDKRKGE